MTPVCKVESSKTSSLTQLADTASAMHFIRNRQVRLCDCSVVMRLTLCARCAPYLNRRVEDMNVIASGLTMIDLKEVPSAFSMLAKEAPSSRQNLQQLGKSDASRALGAQGEAEDFS